MTAVLAYPLGLHRRAAQPGRSADRRGQGRRDRGQSICCASAGALR